MIEHTWRIQTLPNLEQKVFLASRITHPRRAITREQFIPSLSQAPRDTEAPGYEATAAAVLQGLLDAWLAANPEPAAALPPAPPTEAPTEETEPAQDIVEPPAPTPGGNKVLAGPNGSYTVNCPACGCAHQFNKRWSFNGDFKRPTFHPSMLVKSATATNKTICHSFVKDGKIEFLGDCTHALKGQTVDLPDA